jgi:hypothetical protein
MRYRAVLVAGAVLLAACGKSPAPTGTTTGTASPALSPPATKPAFIKAGNDICTSMNTQMNAVPTAATDASQALSELQSQLTILKTGITHLKALPEPPGDTATIQAIFTKVDATTTLLNQAITAYLAGDTTQGDTLEAQVTTSGNAANAAFNAYGLTVCGQS